MQKSTKIALALIIGGALLQSPSLSAQQIEVVPMDLDFGAVDIGNSSSLGFRMSSVGPVPLTVEGVGIDDDPNDLFSLDSFLLNGLGAISGVPPILVMLPGEFLDVTVGFSPDLLGLHTARVHIQSNAVPPNNDFDLPLSGIGTDANVIPEPSTLGLLLLGLVGLQRARQRK